MVRPDLRRRTHLAWRRTTAVAAAVLLLTVPRVLPSHAGPVALAAASLLALLWLAIVIVAQRRIGALKRGGATATVGRALALVALLVAGYATLGLLLVR